MVPSQPRSHASTPPWPVARQKRPTSTTGTTSTTSRQPNPRGRRRFLVRVLLGLLVVSIVVVGLLGYTYSRITQTVTNYPGSHFNQGKNAVWLEHTWVGDEHSQQEYDALAAQLAREQIRYVYAHVGPLESDGTIPNDLAPYASELAASLHARLPEVRVLAWIGQIEAASGEAPDEVVDLTDSRVRTAIAQTAERFVTLEGFDGVHYDIEPITNNNARFLDLLTETRATLPTGAILSISAQKWAPNATVASFLYRRGRADAWWTSYYFAAVAAQVDQMVVLAYNTAMPTGALYRALVQQTTEHVLDAVRSVRHPPEVLIGVPTYEGDDFWFHDSAENMTTGLQGVTSGLNSNRNTAPFVGVAIYRLGTTQQDEWTTYQHLWLGE